MRLFVCPYLLKGDSLNGFINRLIDEEMQENKE